MSVLVDSRLSASAAKANSERDGSRLRFRDMTHDKLYDEATEVTAKDGEVILDGPDGVDVRVTPEAAEETADRLIDGAVEARGQRRLRDLPHQPQ